MKVKSSLLLATLLFLAQLSCGAVAKEQQTNTDSYIESLRAGLHAGKVAIITKAVNFNDKDSAGFWPIYKKYSYDLWIPSKHAGAIGDRGRGRFFFRIGRTF